MLTSEYNILQKKPEVQRPSMKIPTAKERKKKENYRIYLDSLSNRVEQKLYVPKTTAEIKVCPTLM